MQKTSITSSFEMSNSCQNLGGTAWSSSAGSTVSIAASFRKADPRTCGSPTMWSLRSAAQAATALAGICTHRRAHTLGSNDGSGGSNGCSAIHHECLLRLGTGCLTWEASIAAMVSQFGRRHLPHSIHARNRWYQIKYQAVPYLVLLVFFSRDLLVPNAATI